jgi:hypothetical protein
MAAVIGEDRELQFREREIVLRADFSALDYEQCLDLSVRFIMEGPRAPRAGEWVYLLDDRGCGCMGCVESVDGWIARVRPDWATWSGGEKPPIDIPPVPPMEPGVTDPQAYGPGLPA